MPCNLRLTVWRFSSGSLRSVFENTCYTFQDVQDFRPPSCTLSGLTGQYLLFSAHILCSCLQLSRQFMWKGIIGWQYLSSEDTWKAGMISSVKKFSVSETLEFSLVLTEVAQNIWLKLALVNRCAWMLLGLGTLGREYCQSMSYHYIFTHHLCGGPFTVTVCHLRWG